MGAGGLRGKVRGIYATALTKLLLDRGFEVVQPSEEIAERLRLKPSDEPPDVIIADRGDRQGVEAAGEPEALEVLAQMLGQELFDVVLRRGPGGGRAVQLGVLDAEFPYASKARLDEVRGAVAASVPGHHRYKACGGFISSAVDMAEGLIERGRAPGEVLELLTRTVEPHLPSEGSEVGVEHAKLDGAVLDLGRATVEAYDGRCLRYWRELRGGGLYDGLGVEKEAGDRAVTEARQGEYHTETRYYSRGGRFKGAYVNLGTPVELYPSSIRYVDLEVDICVLPEGEAWVVDMDRLEAAAERGVITGRLLELVRAESERLLRRRF